MANTAPASPGCKLLALASLLSAGFNVAVTRFSIPSLTTPNVICLSGPNVPIRALNSLKLRMLLLLTLTIISPAIKPASAAAELGVTWLMNAPYCISISNAFAKSGVSSWPATPNTPRRTSPCSMICCTRLLAIFAGIAKPIPTLPPLGPNIAVLIPINSPRKLSKAPPELPLLIAASV